jgi:hypothetical protein
MTEANLSFGHRRVKALQRSDKSSLADSGGRGKSKGILRIKGEK